MKQKLYIKKDNGRYEEYKEPVVKDDNAYYVKRGRRYVKEGLYLPPGESLPEGIWAVIRHKNSRQMLNCDYLEEQFKLHRLSDIPEPSMRELASREKLVDYLCRNINRIDGKSEYERCQQIVNILFEYKKENE